mmetsp:Transcript_15730/g.34050  ORF Transcript_15730/g.34050 Transcript_15730/m.34050 type:complete len:194 (-) Transcript_15730:144-725(-)|eukprot:CAMPEP_0172297626 /NCGR_PEP_ID=MMETSP1058-20130122/575_1 /TAXON_ID=83371 /ORGANISM="Detonula confervacea, Strain CCMP 353" /LENGTH=193 /DNA_ID=CAMNT_0013006795 /DNA_START=30 /DNA_END=611 /DNA_ORIENTATION=+
MMKLVIFLSAIASATAFAPASQPQQITALSAKSDYANDIGVVAPLGIWDPSSKLDLETPEEVARLRGLELKHGRVAMLGVVGYLTTYAGVRFPGLEDVPAGWAAWGALPQEVVWQFATTLIFMEIANRDQTGGKAEFDGDFRNGFIDFGWDKQTDEWKKKKRTIELNNGRAAQMGIIGLMVHDAMGNVGDILH